MINLILPFISNNFNFYQKLNNYQKKNILFKDFCFPYVYGNFPWSYWHGDKNTNYSFSKTVVLEPYINKFNKDSIFPFMFDFSNLNLEEKDLYDKKLNMILSTLNNGSNSIICSDLAIMEKIQQLYPYYNFIFSEKACLISSFTESIVNTILEQQNIDGIILDNDLLDNNFDYKLIHNKQKVYIKIGKLCQKKCPLIKECLMQEQTYQYNFSIQSNFNTCSYINKLDNLINQIKEEIKYYQALGFTNFILDSPPSNIAKEEYEKYLLFSLLNNEIKTSNTIMEVLN